MTQLDHPFATTHWSVVVAAGSEDRDRREAALAFLCEVYWYPIYAFARRKGQAADDALDVTQGFFTELLDGADLSGADARRGRFRAYLLGAFKHFLSDERRRANTLKRGGGVHFVDGEDAEQRFRLEPASEEEPEKAFERTWAHLLLEGAIERLRREYEEGGKADLFDRLKPTLAGEGEPYARIAEDLETTEGAVKVAVHRLRRRFGEVLRRETGQTLADPCEVEEEIRGLFESLA